MKHIAVFPSALAESEVPATFPTPARRARASKIWMAAAAFLIASAGAQAQNTFGSVAVGSTSNAQGVSVSSPGGGTVASVEVLTAGAAGADFAAGTGASNCLNATLAANSKCTESVTFTPATPGLRMGAVVLLDSGGNQIGVGYISGTGQGGLGVLAPGNVTVVAGVANTYTTVNDGYQATSADLNLPAGVAVDGEGNMYIADSLHNRIRMVCGAAKTATIAGTTCTTPGIISTVAGNGKSSYTGDGGAAAEATLNTPNGVAIDGAGNLYIADTGNSVVRVISAATGIITTVAGNGTSPTVTENNSNQVGDGGPATAANLNQPWGIAVDGSGNLYIADTFDHRIREVSAASGTIETIAGDGFTAADGAGGYNGDSILAASAKLNYPYSVAFDPSGNMYIADAGNARVRVVAAVNGTITAASTITTLAGTGTAGESTDCTQTPLVANQTQLYYPESVAVDAAGNVYIADTQNAEILKVNAASGMLSMVIKAGCGSVYTGSGNFSSVDLYGPKGLYLDGYGNLYLADYYTMVVREIVGNYVAVNDLNSPTRQGSQSVATDETVENDGNAPLDLTAITHDANSAIDASSTCGTGMPYLTVAQDCTVGADFAPTVAGDPLIANIDVAEDTQPGSPGVTAPNSPLDIQIVGNATAVNSTTTTVASAPDPSGFGQSVTFTVTVTTGAGTGKLTGTVSLTDTYQGNTVTLAQNLGLSLNSAGTTGTATFSTGTLGVGQHSIVAAYDNSDDSGHFSSKSTDNGAAPLTQTVLEGTTTTLVSSVNPSTLGQSVKFTATVASSGGGVTPDQTVQFMDGTNTLGPPQTLTASGANGTASYSTATLTNGTHQITAVYGGDAANQIQGSTSNTVSQSVLATSGLTLTSSANPASFGNSVTFTVTMNSTGANPATGSVSFFDNGTQIGTGTLAGSPAVATFATSTLAVGTHPITASYGGDSYNSPAGTAAPLNQVVSQAQTATTVTAAPSPGIAGATETITATVGVTAGVAKPTGTVTFTSGATTLGAAPLAANGTAVLTITPAPGTYQVVATYGGDTDSAGSVSSAFPLTIAQATTQTTLTIAPNPGLVTAPIVFTATVHGNGGVPTGTVTFLANGNPIGSAPANGSGVAAITVSTLAMGTYSVTASYGGDTDDGASASAATALNVTLATSSTTLTASPNPALVGQTITFTAKVTSNGAAPTGTVNFVANGNTLGGATLNAGVATFTTSALPAATYSVTASYVGDSANAASASSALSETVGLIPTETDLGTSTTSGANPQVILVATVLNGATGPMPTGTVTFMSGSTQLGASAIDSSGVGTLVPSLTAGVNYSITAVYSGDINHSTSSSQAVAVNGTANGFSVSATPASVSMKSGDNSTITVNLSSTGGFSDTVAMGCGSLPAGVTCHFSPVSVNLAANGMASTQLTIDTNNPLSGGSSAMNRAPAGPNSAGSALMAGILLPFSGFFGWLFWRLRKRNAGLLTMGLVLALSVGALLASGCSGISSSSVTPGTYTIQIIGTGTNSNVVHYQNETLDITQ